MDCRVVIKSDGVVAGRQARDGIGAIWGGPCTQTGVVVVGAHLDVFERVARPVLGDRAGDHSAHGQPCIDVGRQVWGGHAYRGGRFVVGHVIVELAQIDLAGIVNVDQEIAGRQTGDDVGTVSLGTGTPVEASSVIEGANFNVFERITGHIADDSAGDGAPLRQGGVDVGSHVRCGHPHHGCGFVRGIVEVLVQVLVLVVVEGDPIGPGRQGADRVGTIRSGGRASVTFTRFL